MKKKFFSILLALTMLFNTTSILADTNSTIEYDETTSSTNEFSQDVEFTMSKSSTFTVCLPKEVKLANDVLFYELKAGIYADISAGSELVIEPVDGDTNTTDVIDFKLSNIVPEGKIAKPDIIASVATVKTAWLYNDPDFCSDVSLITLPENQVSICTVSLEEIPSGKWEGNLPIRIALEEASNTIDVNIVDSSDTDLNGKATFIVGDTKATLLSELVNTGHITDVEEVDALVNVNCDTFEDKAIATFNVKGIANPGERIVVYHYDEDASQWEYICTSTVNNEYLIICEFTSFSPVGFVNIGAAEEGHVCEYTKEVTISESACKTEGIKRYICDCGDSYIEKIPKLGHNYKNYLCTVCGQKLVAGLYDADDELLCTWEESGIDANQNYPDVEVSEFYTKYTTSGYYVINRYYPDTVMAVLPEGMQSIGERAFIYCDGLVRVVLPDSIKTMERSIFFDCKKLEYINIPESCTSLGINLFYGCSSLKGINIPSSVNNIDLRAFMYCTSLESVTFQDPNGWVVKDVQNGATTRLSPMDLSDQTTVKTYLLSTHANKRWIKE